MRTIISRTINSEVSPRISLGSDEIYRPLSVGGNWNKLRIGLSLVFTYPGADLAGQPRFFVGVCSRYKSWGSWNAHALGMVSTGAAWNVRSSFAAYFAYERPGRGPAGKRRGGGLPEQLANYRGAKPSRKPGPLGQVKTAGRFTGKTPGQQFYAPAAARQG